MSVMKRSSPDRGKLASAQAHLELRRLDRRDRPADGARRGGAPERREIGARPGRSHCDGSSGSRGSGDPHSQELGGAVPPQHDPDDERHEPPVRIDE